MSTAQKESAVEGLNLAGANAEITVCTSDNTPGINGQQQNSVAAAAVELDAAGLKVIRVQGKIPAEAKGWDKPEYQPDPADIATRFAFATGVGVVLGDQSRGLVDVDLDCALGVRIWPLFAPECGAKFDRGSLDSAHWIYVCLGLTSRKFALKSALLPPGEKGGMVLELRANTKGGGGSQTVFPPTSHESGKDRRWITDPPKFVEVTKEELEAAANKTLTVAYLTYWYLKTVRHEIWVALAGFLIVDCGWSKAETEKYVQVLVEVTGDDELEDRLRCVTDTWDKHNAGDPVLARSGALEELTSEALVKDLKKRLGGLGDDEASPGTKKAGQARLLLDHIKETTELFCDEYGVAWTAWMKDGRREVFDILSPQFKRYLVSWFLKTHNQIVTEQTLKPVLFAAQALAYDGDVVRKPEIRFGLDGETYYIDLANEAGEVITITKRKWEIIPGDKIPVYFHKPAGMLPHPMPVPPGEGEFSLFFDQVNLPNEKQRALAVGALLSVCLPAPGPYANINVTGEAGSAKTAFISAFSEIIDPRRILHSAPPNTDSDIALIALQYRLVAVDNISNLSNKGSDVFCRVNTGCGVRTREFYTNMGLCSFYVANPTLMCGIDDVTKREDLISRTINIIVSPLPDPNKDGRVYRTGRSIKRDLKRDAPSIFGAILDALVLCMNSLELKMDKTPEKWRMAEMAKWIAAGETALGSKRGAFQKHHKESQADAISDAVETNSLHKAIFDFAHDLAGQQNYFHGPLGTLIKRLKNTQTDTLEYRHLSGVSLGQDFNKITKSLGPLGVNLSRTKKHFGGKHERAKWWTLITDDMMKRYPDWDTPEKMGKPRGHHDFTIRSMKPTHPKVLEAKKKELNRLSEEVANMEKELADMRANQNDPIVCATQAAHVAAFEELTR